MIYRLCRLITIIIVLSSFISLLYAKPITMVTVDWAPFYGSEMQDNGVISVIVKNAFQRSGIQSTIKFIPWKRAMKEVKTGTSDILMGAYYTDERNQDYFYSEPIYDIHVGLVALKTLGFKQYETLQDLTPYTIGISRGWANSKAFDEAQYLKKQGATNQTLNVRKLFKHRVDMISISFDVFRYEVTEMSSHKLDDVVFIKPPLKVSAIYLITAISNPNKVLIMSAFNRGLAEMKQDGSYQKILTEYGF